jgi:hypothetical protein
MCISSQKVSQGGAHLFVSIFATKGPKRCFYLGVPNVPKKLVIGQSMWLLSTKRKEKKGVLARPRIN